MLSIDVDGVPGKTMTGNDDEFDEENDLPLSHLLPADITFDEYAAVDENVETCEQLTDDDIITAVMASAEPGSATPLDKEGRGRGRRLDLARPPRSSTGYGGLGHFAALPAGRQQQRECPDEPAVCGAVSYIVKTMHHPNDYTQFSKKIVGLE